MIIVPVIVILGSVLMATIIIKVQLTVGHLSIRLFLEWNELQRLGERSSRLERENRVIGNMGMIKRVLFCFVLLALFFKQSK